MGVILICHGRSLDEKEIDDAMNMKRLCWIDPVGSLHGSGVWGVQLEKHRADFAFKWL